MILTQILEQTPLIHRRATSALGRLVALLASHDLGNGMTNRRSGLFDILLGQGYCDTNLEGRHSDRIPVLGLDGVAEWLRLEASDENAVRKSLCIPVSEPRVS